VSQRPDLSCDTLEHPGCGGPLYLWLLTTTLPYWPVIRCENHLKLQSLWLNYRLVWSKTHDVWKEMPLSFWDWLKAYWSEDVSMADVGPHWELISQETRFARYWCNNCDGPAGIEGSTKNPVCHVCKGEVVVFEVPIEEFGRKS
jgi:hypothetical protein